MIRAVLASILLTGCGCSGPLIPVDASWNHVVAAAYVWAPCPNYVPYFHGYDSDGEPRCTVRPYDPDYDDVDQLTMP